MLRLSLRKFTTTRIVLSKTVSNRIIIPPASHFPTVKSPATSIPRHEYRQLPEDSNYIEKFYDELETFSNEILIKQLKKTYADFDDEPEELLFQLEKYIELQIIPKHSDTQQAAESGPIRSIQCRTLSDKIIIERFLDFARGMKLTLLLNGGHTFIFDVLLQAKQVFDKMQQTKN